MKKRIHIFAAVTALMLSAASCGNTAAGSVSSPAETKQTSESSEAGPREDIVLTAAVSGADYDNVKDAAEKFNAEDNGYKVELKQYFERFGKDDMMIEYSSQDYQMIDFQLIQDIINTNDIDIVFTNSFLNPAKYEILRNKGAFADLYPFMEDDPEVNRSTLDDHILSLNETDGRLYSLPTFYMVWTLCGNEEYVGSNENWTVDEFLSRWQQMPENSTISGSNYAENAYNVVLSHNLCSFVDYENASVSFDSPDFRKMLEFCGQFPSTNGEKMDYDYSAPNFVQDTMLDGIMGAQSFGSDFTLVGYPSSDGNGTYFTDLGDRFSICASSSPEKQKGAWEFIRTFATYEYQRENAIRWIENRQDPSLSHWESERGFCVNKKAFEDIAQNIIDGKYYGGTYESKGETYTITTPTQEQYEELCRYLNSINRWDTLLDDALRDIVREEVAAYFSGEQSLDDTVSMIQNRASIWVSEQS